MVVSRATGPTPLPMSPAWVIPAALSSDQRAGSAEVRYTLWLRWPCTSVSYPRTVSGTENGSLTSIPSHVTAVAGPDPDMCPLHPAWRGQQIPGPGPWFRVLADLPAGPLQGDRAGPQ